MRSRTALDLPAIAFVRNSDSWARGCDFGDEVGLEAAEEMVDVVRDLGLTSISNANRFDPDIDLSSDRCAVGEQRGTRMQFLELQFDGERDRSIGFAAS